MTPEAVIVGGLKAIISKAIGALTGATAAGTENQAG